MENYTYYDLKISSDEFIKESEVAATRTRWTMIVLVLASVLIGIGFYNTTPLSFAPEGISSLYKFENLPVNNFADKENKPMPLLDAYFGENDFSDTKFEKRFFRRFRHVMPRVPNKNGITGLQLFVCGKIYDNRGKAESLENFLYDNFNPETQKLLEGCETKDKPLKFLEDPIKFNYLTTDLNRVLYSKYLYNERRFPEAMINLAQKPDGERRRNFEETRRLLAEWKKAQAKDAGKGEAAENSSESKTKQTDSKSKKSDAEIDSKTSKPPAVKTAAVSPSPSTSPFEDEAVLSSKAKEVDILRLNRLLLEAVFPEYINESADIIPPREARMAKELAMHIAFDENVRYVNIPFFDTSIEVNDLGAFGGVGLIIILLLLRFSLSREIKNFNVSFRQAFYKDELAAFYHKMAMRLFLHVPKMEGESRNQTLAAGSKYMCFLPILILTLGVWYDKHSIYELGVYKTDDIQPHLLIETVCLAVVWYLSLRCLERLTHVDEIWEDYHLIWMEYQKRGRERHDELLSPEIDRNSELSRAITRRVYNKSREGSYPEYKSPISNWGRLWFGRLLTLKNLARLMPVKPLSRFVETISGYSKLWIIIYLGVAVASIWIFSLNTGWDNSFDVAVSLGILILVAISVVGVMIKTVMYLSKKYEFIDRLIKIKPEEQKDKKPEATSGENPAESVPPPETKNSTGSGGKSSNHYAKIYKF